MLTYNLATFFEKIRPYFGNHLTQEQVQNMQVLLERGATEVNCLEAMAYVLATVRHEAGEPMVPVREFGEGHGHPYGGMMDLVQGKLVPYTTPHQFYYGRGHVQLTWRSNYVALGHLVGSDLLNNPDLMLTVEVSAHVAIQGMVEGSFTGHKLADYFGPGRVPDPIQARRIINGVPRGEVLPDKAETIAGYYDNFLKALQAAQQAAVPQVAGAVGAPTQAASDAESPVSAPNPATEEAAAAPGLAAAVAVAPQATCAA